MGWHSEGEGACGESGECVWVPKVGPGRYRVRSGQESEGSPEWGAEGEEVPGESDDPTHPVGVGGDQMGVGSYSTLRTRSLKERNEHGLSGGMWSAAI